MKVPILEVKHISKRFFSKGNEDNYILKDLELIVETNTISCIIGSNGTGKTTLFNIISRLQIPSNKMGQIGLATKYRLLTADEQVSPTLNRFFTHHISIHFHQ